MTNLTKSNKTIESLNFSFNTEKNYPACYQVITNGIKISARPEFVNSQNASFGNLYIWTYDIRIENHSDQKVQLMHRNWKIIDEMGGVQEVDGEGVVGKQPEILPQRFFEYSSGVHLNYPSGIMSGSYKMKNEKGEEFQVEIPKFSLDAFAAKQIIN